MKKLNFNLLLLFFILFLSNSICAQSKNLLQYNLNEGSIYEITSVEKNTSEHESMGQKINNTIVNELIERFVIKEILPDSNYLIEYSILKLTSKINITSKINDTIEVNISSMNYDDNYFLNNPIKEIYNWSVFFELNKNGSIEIIKGINEINGKFDEFIFQISALRFFSNEKEFISHISNYINKLPDGKIDNSSSWMEVNILPFFQNLALSKKLNYKIENIENDAINISIASENNEEKITANIGSDGNVELSGISYGEKNMDRSDGFLRNQKMNHQYIINVSLKNPYDENTVKETITANFQSTSAVTKK